MSINFYELGFYDGYSGKPCNPWSSREVRRESYREGYKAGLFVKKRSEVTLELYNVILLKDSEQQHLLLYANNFVEAQIKADKALDDWEQLGWKLYGVFHIEKEKLERGEVVTL